MDNVCHPYWSLTVLTTGVTITLHEERENRGYKFYLLIELRESVRSTALLLVPVDAEWIQETARKIRRKRAERHEVRRQVDSSRAYDENWVGMSFHAKTYKLTVFKQVAVTTLLWFYASRSSLPAALPLSYFASMSIPK